MVGGREVIKVVLQRLVAEGDAGQRADGGEGGAGEQAVVRQRGAQEAGPVGRCGGGREHVDPQAGVLVGVFARLDLVGERGGGGEGVEGLAQGHELDGGV
jgi:hypothetical protein